MKNPSKLMDMLVGYAAAHQHPFNVAVHLVGIPVIMLGVFIPLTWLVVEFPGIGVGFTAAHAVAFLMFVFYATLDLVFAGVFLAIGLAIAELAVALGAYSIGVSGGIAAAAFFGGYALQFIGHAVEKSMPVLVKHPVQANLAAPFFTVVEIFGLLGLRKSLFDEVRSTLRMRRDEETASTG